MKNGKSSKKAAVKKAHIIVVGNEKGGSGKSTVAMHVVVGLLRLGYKVGTVDLDSHQATFTSYMKNRWLNVRETKSDIPSPEHVHIDRAEGQTTIEKREQERWRVETAVQELAAKNDFVVIDTPGSDRYMSIIGHSLADTLITPINDSFVDLDLLAKIDPYTHLMVKPSVYTEMVWDLKRQREKKDGRTIQWFVVRNRISATDSRNKQSIGRIVEKLQGPLGYTAAPGLTERVIFRELFLKGLTLLDLKEGAKNALSMSNINARQEVRHLVKMVLPNKDVSTLSLLKTY
ncbi:MAG: division plane positioning ATPase MipZ [Alphaproteobacteria bacterium]|nr:division plane positioning ATPase MipZ [Alphaproteobacteria bacterium]